MIKMKYVLVALVPVVLAACGGGNSVAVNPDPNVAGTDIPTSATTTGEGASNFVKRIVLAGDKDMDEPVVDGNVVLAVSETEDPDPSI